MSKLDEMRRMTAGNVDDSMGVGRAVVHGAPTAGGAATPARWLGVSKTRNAAEIPVERIGPDGDQPRETFDEGALARLAESLKTRGQIQPVSVRWSEERGIYVVVAGERRWRAATMAGLKTLSCVVIDRPIPPGELLALQLVENLLREDLAPIEQARAYRSLMESNGWSVSRAARELAVDHSNVSRALALLTLPALVQEQVEAGALSPATAYEVSKLDDPDAQGRVAARVVTEGLSRAATVEAVREAASKPGRAGGSKGRGPAKAKRPTVRIFKTAAARLTIEFRKAVGPDEVRTAVAEVLARLDVELGGDQAAA